MRHCVPSPPDVCRDKPVPMALALVKEHRPDVLISDIPMPEEDGYTLIKRVRALDADEGGHTPAVAS